MTEPLYLDDPKIGLQFESPTFTVTGGDIRRFALEFDPQPFHLDGNEAKISIFGGLAASDWHTAAITMRLLTSGGLPLAGGIIGMGVEINWLKQVRPGDVLRVVSTVQDIKRSKSKRQGVVTVMSETQDKFGEVAQRLLSKLLVTARETEASSN
ncbi:MaoC/PaaZ C-terminal domain-containing protein [Caballeronia ptereochthonis]|uniref:MoaC domain-containing protein n=1 Tax=Caballeronia ptereochthonis TaxID=1777144 RepID=A0A157ZRZ7_9BURK|nr:MaoC/PaaZ C-terminal domain-containing protein [Caballeronia ptereochthonis]SAK48288.1 MoaC domain-containing protein [Caballeronia ptereochthonis]